MLTKDKRSFVDGLVSILSPCDIPPSAARLYGYLLISWEPVSLDQIAADLEISKSSACTAAQLLERLRAARRHAERGSNRVLYVLSDNHAGPLAEQSALMYALSKHMQVQGTKVASGKALKRIQIAARFFLIMGNALSSAAEHFEDDLIEQ